MLSSNNNSNHNVGILLSALGILTLLYFQQKKKSDELETKSKGGKFLSHSIAKPPSTFDFDPSKQSNTTTNNNDNSVESSNIDTNYSINYNFLDLFKKRNKNSLTCSSLSASNIPDEEVRPITCRPRTVSDTALIMSEAPTTHEEGNPSSSAWSSIGLEKPLVIATVGLPARGKSYIVRLLLRYLKYCGFECKVFNVGSYRRQIGYKSANSNFFSSSNKESQQIREQMATHVQDEMYKWLYSNSNNKSNRVAVFDATNTTRKRRQDLCNRARKENTFLLYIESICDDKEVLERNYALKLKNDDYKDMDPEVAKKDFMDRLKAYESVYETIEDDEDNGLISYIKLINVGQKIISKNCHGFLPSHVAFYLQNLHIKPRKIYLSIIAEGIEAKTGSNLIAGAESGILTDDGIDYTINLAGYADFESKNLSANENGNDEKKIMILTGTSKIHANSVEILRQNKFPIISIPLLNELRGGDVHGISKQKFQEEYPEEYNKRKADKLNYRYPGVGGESYMDVVERLRPVIIELERQSNNIMIVSHTAVLRCIYAYFMGISLNQIPFIKMEQHKIYELSPNPFGCSCTVIEPYDLASVLRKNKREKNDSNE